MVCFMRDQWSSKCWKFQREWSRMAESTHILCLPTAMKTSPFWSFRKWRNSENFSSSSSSKCSDFFDTEQENSLRLLDMQCSFYSIGDCSGLLHERLRERRAASRNELARNTADTHVYRLRRGRLFCCWWKRLREPGASLGQSIP